MPTEAYRPRRPAATLLHRTVREHLETYLAHVGCDDDLRSRVPPHVQQAFHAYLRCGILAHGFARAYCHGCGHDFLIAFSCKGRDICPSCATRRMVETAVRRTCPDAPPGSRYGAVAFVHRFGDALNSHVHYHVLVTDGVFSDDGHSGARFHRSASVGPADVATVQRQIRRRGLRWLHRHGHLDDTAVHTLDAADHAGGWSQYPARRSRPLTFLGLRDTVHLADPGPPSHRPGTMGTADA